MFFHPEWPPGSPQSGWNREAQLFVTMWYSLQSLELGSHPGNVDCHLQKCCEPGGSGTKGTKNTTKLSYYFQVAFSLIQDSVGYCKLWPFFRVLTKLVLFLLDFLMFLWRQRHSELPPGPFLLTSLSYTHIFLPCGEMAHFPRKIWTIIISRRGRKLN